MANIKSIVVNGLCTQCGTCIAVCPFDAISLYQHKSQGLLPKVDDNLCTQCGKCVEVCPGQSVDLAQLQQEFFGQTAKDELFGNYIEIFSGYSTVPEIRYNGASGGIVTTILISLLKKGEIDGALVVRMSQKRPLEPEVFIARTEEELISAQQSKYLPVPMNLGLKEIIKDKNGKYAIVGLPCHFHGLRLVEKKNPNLKNKILLRIGLLCGFNPTLSSTKFLLRRAGVKNFEDVKEIKYRDGDWPCGFRAILKDGTDRFLYPIEQFLFSHYVFERHRCAMCLDHTCELADISVGDEWRAKLKKDAGGWSYLIVRTKIGKEIVEKFAKERLLYLEPIDSSVIYGGQYGSLNFKKKGSFAFAKIRRLFNKQVPDYLKNGKVKPKLAHYIGASLIYIMTTFFEIDFFNRLFLHVPTKIFTKYRWLVIRLFRN